MGRFANISGKSAVKAFIKFGFSHSRTTGDHAILQKKGAPTLSIPLHKEVAPNLLKAQIKRAGIGQDEFLKIVK